ncbi:MAG: CoA transferase [Geminicoccaceae bacterium]
MAGVTMGPIKDAPGLRDDGLVAAREARVEVRDADLPGGWLLMHGKVPRLSATPGILARPTPHLGEHGAEILRPLLGEATFAGLCEAGIVQGPDLPQAG